MGGILTYQFLLRGNGGGSGGVPKFSTVYIGLIIEPMTRGVLEYIGIYFFGGEEPAKGIVVKPQSTRGNFREVNPFVHQMISPSS